MPAPLELTAGAQFTSLYCHGQCNFRWTGTSINVNIEIAMKEHLRIGVVGDFNPEFHTHPAIAKAIGHSAVKLGIPVDVEWVLTEALAQPGSEVMLERFHGLIAAPGSPYRSFDGMLRAIGFARTRDWPFSAT
jgi:CTP synthase (UTP-ammonia lyase)